MQLSNIRTEVRVRAGVDSLDRHASDTVLNSLINSALRQMASAHDWDWLNTTAALAVAKDATAVTAMAADTRVVTGVYLDDIPGSLKLVTEDFAAKYSERSGTPRFWFMKGGIIQVSPRASKAFTGYYSYVLDELTLTADIDEPYCPDSAIDWVIITAARMLAARLDNTSQYRLLAEEGKKILDGLRDDARKARPTPTINSRRDWHV